jgi:eukaryotic-like serine/threonine-protein kinase
MPERAHHDVLTPSRRAYDGFQVAGPVQQGDLVAGKYRVTRVLGEGGMGLVVAAVHEQLEQPVALKFLHAEHVSRPEVVQRFLREARAAVKIHSEHVARVLDVGTNDDGAPFMVMEYLQGEDLEQILTARGPLPVQEAVGYVLQACEAVAEAHSLGIVHRDLKPANLFVAARPSSKPVVKVLDFGISKIPSTAKDVALTSAQAMMGSPGYMSPEQMTEARTAGVRSDVWSLGVVLYELLTARLPFSGDTMPELVASILAKTPAPIATARADVPAGVQALVDQCLQKDPAARYTDIGALARALAPFGPPRSEQSVERIEHVLGQGDAAVAPTQSMPAIRTDDYHRSQPEGRTLLPTTSRPAQTPSRVRPALLGLGVLVLGGGTALLVMRPWKTPAPTTAPASAVLTTPPAPTTASVATEATASAAPSAAPAPSTTAPAAVSSAPAAPWWANVKVDPHAHPSAHPGAASAPAASAGAPACRLVSYFDADGNKHFKQECP